MDSSPDANHGNQFLEYEMLDGLLRPPQVNGCVLDTEQCWLNSDRP